MVLLGLLLMLGCAALATDAAIENHGAVQALVFNQQVNDLSLGTIFVVGCVVGLLFALGLSMFIGGMTRGISRRRERRALLRTDSDAEALRERNARLESELAARDTAAYPAEPATTPADADDSLFSGRHRVD